MHDQIQYHQMDIYIKSRQQQLIHEAEQQQLMREARTNQGNGSILQPVFTHAGEILITVGHQLKSRYSSPTALSTPMTEPCVEACG